MGTNYHMEVLRKTRTLDRKREANSRLIADDTLSVREMLRSDQNQSQSGQRITLSANQEEAKRSSTASQSAHHQYSSRIQTAAQHSRLPSPQKKSDNLNDTWRPNPLVASIERDNIQQIMHPLDFTAIEVRKQRGIEVTDGLNYYKPRPKSNYFEKAYHCPYIWT